MYNLWQTTLEFLSGWLVYWYHQYPDNENKIFLMIKGRVFQSHPSNMPVIFFTELGKVLITHVIVYMGKTKICILYPRCKFPCIKRKQDKTFWQDLKVSKLQPAFNCINVIISTTQNDSNILQIAILGFEILRHYGSHTYSRWRLDAQLHVLPDEPCTFLYIWGKKTDKPQNVNVYKIFL